MSVLTDGALKTAPPILYQTFRRLLIPVPVRTLRARKSQGTRVESPFHLFLCLSSSVKRIQYPVRLTVPVVRNTPVSRGKTQRFFALDETELIVVDSEL